MKQNTTSHILEKASARINHDRTLRAHFGSSDKYCAECLSVFFDTAQEPFVNLERTRRLPLEHIDAQHRERRTDLAAQTELRETSEPVVIVFVTEHKSDSNSFAAVRQLLAQIARLSESHPDKLVTGGILYNGPDPCYRGPESYLNENPLVRRLSEPQRAFLRPCMLEFKPFFVNLQDTQVQRRFETLSPESRATLVALTAPWERRGPQREALVRRIMSALRQVADRQKQLSQTWVIVQYLLKYWPECTIDAIIGFEKAALPPQERIMEQFKDELVNGILDVDVIQEAIQEHVEELAADYVEEGVKQGMQQGMQQGEKQAQHTFAERSLAKGLDVATIAEITGLSHRDIQQINDR